MTEAPRVPPVTDPSLVKKALVEIRDLRAKLEQRDRAASEPIAIVGIGCRLPGASSPDEFWTLLREGRETVGRMPRERWDADALFDANPDAAGKLYTTRGGFLDHVDEFDAGFFGITPREAVSMDPQQRLLLEVAWEALEHAGMAPSGLIGAPVGVFVGLAASEYLQLQLRALALTEIDAYLASGTSPAVASGRLSYLLGFQGPSFTVDSACSASLVAVHLACQSLRNAECRMALAGGVSLTLLPEFYVNFSRARMLAPDGRCKTFDAAADGYARSEGCGLVVLKRLADAQADGDRVLAVVRGSAVNQDGRSSGLTVPNGPAQEAVIREALTRAGVKPGDVGYVEAHGTGTSLGDPIEVRALGNVFSQGHTADRPLYVGSVKTNIGHTEAAAGIAGLIKVVLSLQRSAIPPHLHFRTPNPLIAWNTLPIAVPTALVPWPAAGPARMAGVSAFGFSGTNAHVVLEEAPRDVRQDTVATPAARLFHVLPLSAKTPEALRTVASQLARHLATTPGLSITDVCRTAGAGRSHFHHRAAFVSDTTEHLRATLSEFADGARTAVAAGTTTGTTDVAFLFTGQGSQYAGMAQGVYRAEPVFRDAIDRCETILRPHVDRPLTWLLFDDASGLLDETAYTQPAIFAVEYALSELWRSWGLTPSIVMGHSLGEDIAACVAGVMTLEDALVLVARRGQLMQALPGGGEMVAAVANEATVRRALALHPAVSLAAVNGPDHVTLSGGREDLRRLVADLEREGVKVRPVSASHAFHSPLIDPMLDEYERLVSRLDLRPVSIPLVSSVTGTVAADSDLRNPSYWRRHVREPVQFAAGMQTLWNLGHRVFIEIGPTPVLLGMGRRAMPDEGTWLPSLRKGRDDVHELMTSVGGAYVAGVVMDWAALDGGRRPSIALPTYPFQRQKFWCAPAAPVTRRPDPDVETGRSTRAIGAAARQAGSAPTDLALSTYAAKWSRLDDLAVAYVISAFRTLGVFRTSGSRVSPDDLAARLGMIPTAPGLLRRWLEELVRRRHLRADGDHFVADASLPAIDPEAIVRGAADLFADFPAPLDYVTRSGARLVDLLTGRESPLEVLFPGGSTDMADALYSTSALARYSNAIAHAAVVGAALGATPDCPVRVLEIGAGTGGTTAGLLPQLSPASTRYTFSDIGSVFLDKARARFKPYAFVAYRALDIERQPGSQGFLPHEFDIVIAANALHATKDLHATLEHVAWLLAPGGTLVLCEATTHAFWLDVTTALIGGWRRFEDELRDDVPLLAPEAWTEALRRHGFETAEAFPDAASPASVLRQHVIVAAGPPADEASTARAPRHHEVAVVPVQVDQAADVIVEALASLSEVERHEALVGVVRECVAGILRLDAAHPLDRNQRLMDLGVDSLMAVEIRNVLSGRLRLDRKVPSTLIFDHPTVEAIARFLDRSMRTPDPEARPGEESPSPDPPALEPIAGLEEMSDADVEALLNKRLESM